MLTDRQEQVLEKVVAEYIALAQPVSSQYLEEAHDFGCSTATIRNELVALSDQGYLVQPHTSSGRVPTDKGYRFFVDRVLEHPLPRLSLGAPRLSLGAQDPFAGLQEVSRQLALASSMFAAVSFGGVVWKEGWERLFLQPEFEDSQALRGFVTFVQDFERSIDGFSSGVSLHISIGKENRFSRVKDFSIILKVCEKKKKEHMVMALLGPRRMAYEKNIQLMQSLVT